MIQDSQALFSDLVILSARINHGNLSPVFYVFVILSAAKDLN